MIENLVLDNALTPLQNKQKYLKSIKNIFFWHSVLFLLIYLATPANFGLIPVTFIVVTLFLPAGLIYGPKKNARKATLPELTKLNELVDQNPELEKYFSEVKVQNRDIHYYDIVCVGNYVDRKAFIKAELIHQTMLNQAKLAIYYKEV